MKPAPLIVTGLAAFAGVAGALQFDRTVLKSGESKAPETSVTSSPAMIRPAIAESGAPSFDFTAAAKKASPSVVSVDRYEGVQRGFDVTTVEETGTGSGVIVSSDGTIVTNNHVIAGIEGSGGKVTVRLSDKRSFDAKILGADPRSDLAVLKINTTGLTPIEFADPSEVQVGMWVLAVGNPLGFDNTVSVGVVSSLKRNLPVGAQGLVNAIQTDAAINPGNSGGALTDAQGRLVGINTAIASNTQGSIGIGFAIPVDRVKKVVGDIVKNGTVQYAGLGVRYNSQAFMENPRAAAILREQLGVDDVPKNGLIVGSSDGEAAKAGINALDVITDIDDTKISSAVDLNAALLDRKAGDKVRVKYWSKGANKSAVVTLQPLVDKL